MFSEEETLGAAKDAVQGLDGGRPRERDVPGGLFPRRASGGEHTRIGGLVRVEWSARGASAAARPPKAYQSPLDAATAPRPPAPPDLAVGLKHGAWAGYRAATAESGVALLTDPATGDVVDGDRALPLLLAADNVVAYPLPEHGAVASVTLVAGGARNNFERCRPSVAPGSDSPYFSSF